MDHDLDLGGGSEIDGEELDIEVGKRDNLEDFSVHKRAVIKFKRDHPVIKHNRKLGKKRVKYINHITSWLDAGNVYGKDKESTYIYLHTHNSQVTYYHVAIYNLLRYTSITS